MITVLRKSTVRPLPSVRRPSSRICSNTLKTSGCAFSISSSSTTAYGLPADLLGELAALFVADIARRRADHARDGMLFHVFGHVEANQRLLVVEKKFGERSGQLGLADAGRAQENERADGPLRIGKAGAAAANGVGDVLERVILPDHALAQALFHVHELLDFAFEQAADRNAGPLG